MAACGEPGEFEVTTRHWCWTWHGPWRCKETKIQTLYVYEFAVLRERDRFFSASYQACCEFAGGEFAWSGSTWRAYFNPPDQFNVTRRFKQKLTSTGPCTLGHL